MKRILIAAGTLAGACAALIVPSMRKQWMKDYTGRYYAHRGLHANDGEKPENSLAAIAHAAEQGYGIEFDVQLSKDGVPVIMHDFLAERTLRREDGTPVSGCVRDYTLEALRPFHILNSNEKIPTLQEVLDAVDGRVPLIVELKADLDQDDPEAVCRKADEVLSHYRGRYVIESFHPGCVRWYRKHRPEVIRGQLSDGFLEQKYGLRYLPVEYLLTNAVTRPDFIAYHWEYASNPSLRILRRLFGCPTVAWTIRNQNTLDAMKKQFDLLIFDSFVPDEPEEKPGE
jgi:glycerophosphoryl diester phosphodiesterase